MSFYIKNAIRNQDRSRRGTATIETLLIMIPTCMFFMLCLWVMNYWESEHLDSAVDLETQFAQHTVTGLFLTKGSKGSPNETGDYKWYLNEKNASPSKYYAYTTDNHRREHKIMAVRGTTTWTSFIWLRGQHSSWLMNKLGAKSQSSEGEACEEWWFERMGGSDLDDQRKPLQLGS